MAGIDWSALGSLVTARWGCALPDLYRRLHEDGRLDPQDERHLQLADLVWLTPDRLLRVREPPDQLPGLLPFAETTRGDLWCVHTRLDPDWPEAIAFCPDEDEVAVVYAPDLAGFLYRALLDEFACSCHGEPEVPPRPQAALVGLAQAVGGYLPAAWRDRLARIATRTPRDLGRGYGASLGEVELREIVAADLAFPHLEREFAHFTT